MSEFNHKVILLGFLLQSFVGAEPNLVLLSERRGCFPVLLDLLAQYELHLGAERLCAKVVGNILNIFLKLISTGECTRSLVPYPVPE